MSGSGRQPEHLRFALVTDLHFGPAATFRGKLRKLSHHAEALTRDFVQAMNERERPDFIVNLGDDIEDEDAEQDRRRYQTCQDILNRADADLVNVAGNHDLKNLSGKDLLAIWKRSGTLHYSFDRGGVHFVVLDTHERKDVDVRIDETQLEWLRGDLATTTKPVIVLMHHSAADQDLAGNRWFENRAHLCLVQERAALRAILEESGRVLAVFNGHLHWNHLDMIGGIAYVTLQSLVENLDADAPGRPARAHAVVDVTPDHLLVRVLGEEELRYQLARVRPSEA